MIRTTDDGIDPEVGTSWGSFQIWIEGRNLCAHRSTVGKSTRCTGIFLPLIEWFARNWDPLLHEERLPVLNECTIPGGNLCSRPGFRRRPSRTTAREPPHGKASGRGGGIDTRFVRRAKGDCSPDVVLRRLRDSIEISWGPARSAGMPQHFSFLEPVQGVSKCRQGMSPNPCMMCCRAPAPYLLSQAPKSPRIQALGRSLRGLCSVDESDRRIIDRERIEDEMLS